MDVDIDKSPGKVPIGGRIDSIDPSGVQSVCTNWDGLVVWTIYSDGNAVSVWTSVLIGETPCLS